MNIRHGWEPAALFLIAAIMVMLAIYTTQTWAVIPYAFVGGGACGVGIVLFHLMWNRWRLVKESPGS